MALKDSLLDHLKKVETIPYLFIGAGLSRRYLGLEGWEGLLRKFAEETKKPYEYYKSKAHSNYPAIGSALANDFNELWFSAQKYKGSRATYAARCTDVASALKFEIAEYMKSAGGKPPKGAVLKDEIELLSKATIEGIITTNWDQHLESIFPDFKAFVGQDQLLFGTLAGIGEIYKIHGCVTDPNSFVLTAEDYHQFNERNAYLVAKLLSAFVEHPVIFLGYSLQDDNVQAILKAIAHILTDRTISALQDRLIFIEWDPDEDDATLTHSTRVFDGIAIPVYTANQGLDLVASLN